VRPSRHLLALSWMRSRSSSARAESSLSFSTSRQINSCGCTVHRLICGASAESVQGPRASCPLRRRAHGATACPGRVLSQAECCAMGLSERTVVQLTRHTAALGVLRWHPLEKPCTWEHLGLDSARQALPSMSPEDRQGLEAEVAQAFRKPAMTDRFLTPAARLPRPPGGGHLTPCEQGLSKTTQQHTCWKAQATTVSLSGVWNWEACSQFILPGHA